MPLSQAARTTHLLPAFTLVTVAGICVAELLTPAVAGVGVLACVPILIASFSDDRRAVWATCTGAILAFGIVAFLASQTTVPAANASRAITLFCLVMTATLGLLLQKHRVAALRLRNAALSTSEMNRLLMSLLAHDLRAPLSLADQGFQYVEESAVGGYPVDPALVSDVRARLQRSLRAIEMVLSLGHQESAAAADAIEMTHPVSLRDEIAEEIASFAYEARARGKVLHLELDGIADLRHLVNLPVLRQALAIPLDNAVRYAVPGNIRVSASIKREHLDVHVEDAGPGLTAHRRGSKPSGSGLGLQLCAALLARAGGSLRVERDADDGTAIVVTLPIRLYESANPPCEPLVQLAVPV